jgi:hypothetical protein
VFVTSTAQALSGMPRYKRSKTEVNDTEWQSWPVGRAESRQLRAESHRAPCARFRGPLAIHLAKRAIVNPGASVGLRSRQWVVVLEVRIRSALVEVGLLPYATSTA